MLLSVHLMIYFPPWNCLLALCPLASWNYILTNLVYAIIFNIFVSWKKNSCFIDDFLHWPPNRTFLPQHEIPSSILSAQIPGKHLGVLFSCSISFSPFFSASLLLADHPWSISQLHCFISIPSCLYVYIIHGCIWSTCKSKCSCGIQRAALGISPPLCPVLR